MDYVITFTSTLLIWYFLAPPKWNLTISGGEDHHSWPRSTTTLTHFVRPADPVHGFIKKYDVFVVFYGRMNPDLKPKKRTVRLVKKPINGNWNDTTLDYDAQSLPIVYADKTSPDNLDEEKLEVTIGGDDRPLQPASFYQIYLRAYTTVCDIKQFYQIMYLAFL